MSALQADQDDEAEQEEFVSFLQEAELVNIHIAQFVADPNAADSINNIVSSSLSKPSWCTSVRSVRPTHAAMLLSWW